MRKDGGFFDGQPPDGDSPDGCVPDGDSPDGYLTQQDYTKYNGIDHTASSDWFHDLLREAHASRDRATPDKPVRITADGLERLKSITEAVYFITGVKPSVKITQYSNAYVWIEFEELRLSGASVKALMNIIGQCAVAGADPDPTNKTVKFEFSVPDVAE